MIGQGIKNTKDIANKAINHARSRISGMDFRPQFMRPVIDQNEKAT